MKYYAISDPEGFDLLKLSEFKPDSLDILYICGDILDSTFVGKLDDNPYYLDDKSNNLKNIQTVLKNNNIKLLFGNRDLNKIKCKYLCHLKQGNNPLVTDFNNGNINLDINTYNELKLIIATPNPWEVESMKSWYTFWAGGVGNEKTKKWNVDANYSGEPFLTRFNEIFGADNNIGTMSAGNLLYTIPNELGKYYNYKDKEDYLAFIVLAVFKSMLIKNIDVNHYNKIFLLENLKTINNTKEIQGLLYKLYNKCNAIKYINDNTNHFIFSHGGVSKDLINDPTPILNSYNQLGINNYELYTYLTNADKFYKAKQIGGYYDNSLELFDATTTTGNNKIEYSIKIINKTIKDSLKRTLDSKNILKIPNNDVLFLLIMTAPFNCTDYVGKLDPTKSGKKMCESLNKSITARNYSPILPGVKDLRKLVFGIKNNTVYQIIGHVPSGYSSTIDYFEDNINNSKSVVVNLDTSNTFLGTNSNIYGVNRSKSYITIENNIITTYTDIHTKLPVEYYNNENLNKDNLETSANIFRLSNDLKGKIKETDIVNIKYSNVIDDELLDIIRKFKKISSDLFIHGYLKPNQLGGAKKNKRAIISESSTTNDSSELLSELSSDFNPIVIPFNKNSSQLFKALMPQYISPKGLNKNQVPGRSQVLPTTGPVPSKVQPARVPVPAGVPTPGSPAPGPAQLNSPRVLSTASPAPGPGLSALPTPEPAQLNSPLGLPTSASRPALPLPILGQQPKLSQKPNQPSTVPSTQGPPTQGPPSIMVKPSIMVTPPTPEQLPPTQPAPLPQPIRQAREPTPTQQSPKDLKSAEISSDLKLKLVEFKSKLMPPFDSNPDSNKLPINLTNNSTPSTVSTVSTGSIQSMSNLKLESESINLSNLLDKSSNKYIVFTYMVPSPPFNKIFFILNETEVNSFINSKLPKTGGDPYYSKYLKYKQKYLSLKHHLNK